MQLIVTLCILFIVIGCSVAQAEKKEIPKGDMVSSILNKLAEATDPGIQYIVVNKSSIITDRNVGLSNIDKGVPLSSCHTMAGFSMTKTLTAIVILQLVERKEINLDDKVSNYVEHPYDSEISIRHLLSHTSGIPNPMPLKWVHLAKDHGGFDEEAALAKVLNENPDSDAEPGAEYSYTNIGYWLHIKNVYLNGPSFGGAIGSAASFSKILQDFLSEQPRLLNEKT